MLYLFPQPSTAQGIRPSVLSRQGCCPPGPKSPLRMHHTRCAACSVLHCGVRWEERLREDEPLLQVVHDRVQKRRLPRAAVNSATPGSTECCLFCPTAKRMGRINTPRRGTVRCSGRTLTHRVRCPKRRSALQTGLEPCGFCSCGSQAQGAGQAGGPTWPSPVSLRLTAELMKPSTHIDKIVAYKPSSAPTHGESECRTTVRAAGCARDGASQSQPDEGKARQARQSRCLCS